MATPSRQDLWNDVLFIVKLCRKISEMYPLYHALWDYCSATGERLAVVDAEFVRHCDRIGSGFIACRFAGFYDDSKHYMASIPSSTECQSAALYASDDIWIIPRSICTNERCVGAVEREALYASRTDQCRGYNRSIVDRASSQWWRTS